MRASSASSPSTTYARRREAWFLQGTEALSRVLGQKVDGYLCPLCLEWCPVLDDVSLEDAPPASVGGKPIALTCRRCSNTAGAGIDAQLRRGQDIREWFSGRSTRPVRMRMVMGDTFVRGETTWTEEGVKAWGVRKANDPTQVETHIAAMDAMTRLPASEQAFNFQLEAFNDRHARIALLKGAYVAAFAALGYRYILRPALEVVRQQIREPDEEHITRFGSSLPTLTPGERDMLSVGSPRSLRSLIVRIDEHLIFLPAWERTPRIYERLEARAMWPMRPRSFRAMRGDPLPGQRTRAFSSTSSDPASTARRGRWRDAN